MRRAVPIILAAGCLIALTLACFGSVLLHDRQFSYRDAGEFYYPLYQRVQQEWEAGRWPLWEPEENGGMPLLGNPSAAVLYPGKILFALPYAWGARLYVISHVYLAFAAMLTLLRSWGISRSGSGIGALAYAFGAPVLSQYCNVIFLVGAAWAPLGLLAVDRLVRLGRRRASLGLAAVLALQMLGGDPEAAYLVVLCGGLYAIALAVRGDPSPREGSGAGGPVSKAWRLGIGLSLTILAWSGITTAAAASIKASRGRAPSEAGFPSPTTHQVILLIGWGLAAALLWSRGRTRAGIRGTSRSLAALGGSAALAMALGAAQFLPVIEFSRLSTRGGAGIDAGEMYAFSVEPWRAAEWVWPGFFGSYDQAERFWLQLVPPRHVVKPWVPSLYLGGLCLVLAMDGAGLRGGPPWRAWLTAIAAMSLLGALGEFVSPVWWARAIPGMQPLLGDRDPSIYEPPRSDGGVADGFGSPYGLLATLLPGFGFFRYPGKLLIFASLALSALAAIGWDRWRDGHAGRAPKVLLALSIGALVVVVVLHAPLVRLLHSAGEADAPVESFDARGAVEDLRRALGQGTVVMAFSVALAAAARRRRRWVAPAALIVLTADLAAANAPLLLTVPQALFDREPKLARLIADAERHDPAPGPFRIHRMQHWVPSRMSATRAADLHLRLTRWEYDTLKPKYGLLHGLSYTHSGSTLALDGYSSFFAWFHLPLDARRGPLRGAEHGQPILYYTRRGYDLWGSRYFVLPFDPAGWQDGSRGFVSFLPDSELIAPDPALLEGGTDPGQLESWIRDQDWQLFRNRAAFPRAWVVHRLRPVKPSPRMAPGDLDRLMGQILYADDAIWTDPGRPVFDPRTMAWIETDDPRSLGRYSPITPPDATETVTITRYDPQRVEIEAQLASPGVVILADVDYPGWALTIDGRPAPILRANRLMRGAAVEAGRHRLVYRYQPLSFRLGCVISLAGIALWIALGLRARERGREPESG